jgi:hypothetical protein
MFNSCTFQEFSGKGITAAFGGECGYNIMEHLCISAE